MNSQSLNLTIPLIYLIQNTILFKILIRKIFKMENSMPKCLVKNDCYTICSNPTCNQGAFMCKQDDCECDKYHKNCMRSIRWNILKQKIGNRLEIESPKYHQYMSKVDQIYKNVYKQIEKNHSTIKQNLMDTFYGKAIREFNVILDKGKYGEINGKMISQIQKQLNDQRTIKVKNTQTIKQKINELICRLNDQLNKLSLEKNKYRFLESQKAKSIIITQDCLTAIQNQNSDQRFVFLQPKLQFNKTQKVKFYITALQNWIGLGICFKEKIIKNTYKFQSPYIKHWTYMLSSNGFMWSHGQKFKQSGFTFKLGNTILITFDPFQKQLIFQEPQNEQHFIMKIDLGEVKQIQNICFCVNLTSKNDGVRIVEIQE